MWIPYYYYSHKRMQDCDDDHIQWKVERNRSCDLPPTLPSGCGTVVATPRTATVSKREDWPKNCRDPLFIVALLAFDCWLHYSSVSIALELAIPDD